MQVCLSNQPTSLSYDLMLCILLSLVTFLTAEKERLDKIKDINSLKKNFADTAAKYSSCPSSKKGGSLGKFTQGQMVPAFDKVVFKEAIGVVHGPVKVSFLTLFVVQSFPLSLSHTYTRSHFFCASPLSPPPLLLFLYSFHFLLILFVWFIIRSTFL